MQKKHENSFGIKITDDVLYLDTLINFIKNNTDLTISEGSDVKGGDITHAKNGNIVTVGTSNKFDVNWIRRPEFAADKGIIPVYDLVKDWKKIKEEVLKFDQYLKDSQDKFDGVDLDVDDYNDKITITDCNGDVVVLSFDQLEKIYNEVFLN